MAPRYTSSGRILFAGGSYSKTFAYCRDDTWKVVKQCKIYNHRDKDLRLQAEMESIVLLPPEAQKLFPKVLDRKQTTRLLIYEMEYIPYENFSEVVRSGKYSAIILSDLLEKIYSRLFDVLYLPPTSTNNTSCTINYVATIKQRLCETIRELPKDHLLCRFLNAESIVINDVVYPGLESTLKLAEKYLDNKKMPLTYNHGDLILQDILVDPKTSDFRLVDANGYSSGYINDFAKTLLCLKTKYDIIYNGDFCLRTKAIHKQRPEANLTFTALEHFKTLNTMNNNFQNYLKKNQERFFSHDKTWKQTLGVLCGLQNIAIVMFHVLHHKKSRRACSFLLSGIVEINDTLYANNKHFYIGKIER